MSVQGSYSVHCDLFQDIVRPRNLVRTMESALTLHRALTHALAVCLSVDRYARNAITAKIKASALPMEHQRNVSAVLSFKEIDASITCSAPLLCAGTTAPVLSGMEAGTQVAIAHLTSLVLIVTR